jgi:hypothetical protein
MGMHVYTNHCWCSDSNWGGSYDCRIILSIHRIGRGKGYYDTPEEDWTNLTEEFEGFDHLEFEAFKKACPDTDVEQLRRMCVKPFARRLKPEVLQWLHDNVPDKKGHVDKENPKGWCVGSEGYMARDSLKVSIFFYRRSDALNFIRTWSKYKKPVSYFNYFKDTRQELDLETNKLRYVEEFSD